jgi:signal transduction histidine kinase
MFKKAQIKLTIIYTALIFFLFWGMSCAIYFGIDRSLCSTLISEVKVSQPIQESGEFGEKEIALVRVVGQITLSHLRKGFIIFNGVLFVLIPIFSWFLAKKTLHPIYVTHEQQKQFVSDVSHELRTPLSILSGEIEVALEQERSVEEYRRVLNQTKEETENLSSLVDNLLFLARYDQGKLDLPLQQVDIVDLIYSVIGKYHIQALEKEISVIFESPEDSIILGAHEIFISRLFSNLLDNAIKYSNQRGKIVIKCSLSNQSVVLSVSDSGIGISQKELEKVWERFYRADTSRSETTGYGLGLSICQSIVSFYHGTITVNSLLGKGTTVSVKIPLSFSSNSHN